MSRNTQSVGDWESRHSEKRSTGCNTMIEPFDAYIYEMCRARLNFPNRMAVRFFS
jgi:hypothetical protein